LNIIQNDKLLKQRERRKLNGNADTKKYEKTKRGFLMRLYRNMQSRVEGVQKLKQHLYKDKSLLDRETFYHWAMYDEAFHGLFRQWEESNYSRKLTPSVDRINSASGYSIENMEWITHSENSRRGAVSRHEKNSSNW
jgi:4-alpha-glucanotransferase